MSFGWSNTGWESERFYNANAVERMAKDWKAEAVRASYGATSLAFSNPDAAANRSRVETVIDAAIENDVFAIIDWHSHNAQKEVQQSKDFFAYMAQKYGEYAHVIFELYNEPYCKRDSIKITITQKPDGTFDTTATRICLEITPWADIKAYAEEIIPAIREYSDNLILVGTPFYSQRVQDVIGKKIKDPNLGYVLHFYADSHNSETWRSNMLNAINDTMPLFVTEYGTTNADGGQPPNNYNTHNAARSDAWHDFMDSRKISSVAWNINDKYEGSAFFGTAHKWFNESEQSVPANWADESKMTESGKYIFRKLNEYYKCLPWNPEPNSSCSTPILPPSQPLLPGAVYEIYSLQGKKMGGDVLSLKNGVYILILRQNGAAQTKTLRIVK